MRTIGLANYRNAQKKLRENGYRGETEACRRIVRSTLPQVGEALEKDLLFYSDRKNNPPIFLMYIMDFDPYELAFIALREMFNSMDDFPTVREMGLRIGKAVELVSRRYYFEDNRGKWDEYLLKKKQKPFKGNRRSQQEIFFEEEEKHERFGDFTRFKTWDNQRKTLLGVWLTEIVRIHTGLFEIFMVKKRQDQQSVKHIRTTDKFNDWLHRFDRWKELMRPSYLATEEEPTDWSGSNVGGYEHDGELPLYFVKNRPELGDMHKLFKSVNRIQKVKWMINDEVLEVASKSWREGLCLGGMPTNEELPVEGWFEGDTESDEFINYKARRRRAIEHNLSLRGRRLRTTKTVYMGEYYQKNRPNGFYFPHNVDYRGRVYPLPSYVNPQSDDLGRSMLLFAEGHQIVDEDDFNWIRVQGANSFGIKGTFGERIEWTKSRHLCILASADDPFGEQWWTEASDPWSFLAFCFEYKKWHTQGYGYVSHFPVAQDASNNGIQIMSLLVRDEDVAGRVNLVPDRPVGDLYQEVIDRVIKRIKADRSKNAFAAAWFKFGVTRKYGKPVVMRRPYGGFGFNDVNILMPIYEAQVEKSYRPFDKGEMIPALGYLSRLINQEVDKLIPKEMELMKWLKSLYRDGALSWSAPYGHTVTINIATYKKVRFKTVVNGVSDSCFILEPEGVNVKKIRRAFIANYVHSIDASILHRVAEQMEFDIGFVHDSFCCHAPHINSLKRSLLKTYEEIFSRNLLDELSQQVSITQETERIAPPQFGTLDVSQISRCKYVYH